MIIEWVFIVIAIASPSQAAMFVSDEIFQTDEQCYEYGEANKHKLPDFGGATVRLLCLPVENEVY